MEERPESAVVLGLAAVGGACVALAPVAGGTAAVIAAPLLARRGHPILAITASALLVAGGVRAEARVEEARAAYAALLGAAPTPRPCALTIEIESAPSRTGADAATLSANASVAASRCGDVALPAQTGLRVHGLPAEARRGDRFEVRAKVGATHLFDDEGGGDPRARLARAGVVGSAAPKDLARVHRGVGLGALVDRARASVRARIDATFAPDAAPLARALVLGESGLSDEDGEAFRASGLAHLLAVSGTHLVLAVATVVRVLRACLARVPALAARGDVGRLAALVGVPLAWLYCDFAGGSGSAVRAAAMLSCVFAARAAGRRPDATRAFGLSLLGCGLVDPLAVTDPSFALSVGATAGLLALGGPFERALVRGPAMARPILRAVSTTLAASAGCAAPLLSIAPGLPVLAALANLIASPLGELAALPACLAHAALAPAPWAEDLAARLGGGALLGVRAVAHLAARLGPTLLLPPPTDWQLAVLAVVALALWLEPRRVRLLVGLGLAALGALELGARADGAPRGLLRLTVIDVGQGDALALDLPDGRLVLIDTGGLVGSPIDTGRRAVLPLLRARRRSAVDVVVISHPHPDHFGGLGAIAAALPVGELWDTGQAEAEGGGAYSRALEGLAARGTTIRRPSELCGAPLAFEGGDVRVLAPCPGFHPDRGANDNSFVLRVSLGARAFLLVGDAEREEEEELVAMGAELRADVLKVGHHGSRTSSSEGFLDAVAPELAVVSTGVRNRFGHPHAVTVEAFASREIPLLRTDRGGEIRVTTDGAALWVDRGGRLEPR